MATNRQPNSGLMLLFVVAIVTGTLVWLWLKMNQGQTAFLAGNPLPHAFKDNPGGMVWLVALVAFWTAALVQLLKDVSSIRFEYQHKTLQKWVASRSRGGSKVSDKAVTELEQLASGQI